ncbi:thioesterase family protein [Streptomyces sp. NBC_00233]|uniref:acyl-CoA thioesterase n=1 Tax=Streptomyces sp. NBC_00233 TaxID=2975686 RepID=UPI002255FCEC|nr:thioesterase family protein [Streptomyces sp. NBC_00233]MCX5233335.1 thioesterase family protein [Streptomyces sp. NBC_00233]
MVYPWHCDHMGHMNVMWYVGKFDEATWNLLASIGITSKLLQEEGRGMVAVQQDISYRQEVLAGDVVRVESVLLEVRPKVIRFVHEMKNAVTDELVAVTHLTGVHIDSIGRRSRPLPDEIVKIASSFVDPDQKLEASQAN